VFAHRSGKYDWLGHLEVVDTLLNPDLDQGEHSLDGIDTTYVIRRLGPDMADGLTQPAAEQSAWISLKSASTSSAAVQRYHSPSLADAVLPDTTFDIVELPGSSFFPAKAEDKQFAAIGNAVHRYLASIPSIRALSDADKLLVAERCLAAYSVSGVVPSSVLVSAGERFSRWVESMYPEAVWHVEIPVSSPRADGGQWAGVIDLILQLSDGSVVVIDHKSAPIRTEHCAKKASEYSGQLSAYDEILRHSNNQVRAAWIHFPLASLMCRHCRGVLEKVSSVSAVEDRFQDA